MFFVFFSDLDAARDQPAAARWSSFNWWLTCLRSPASPASWRPGERERKEKFKFSGEMRNKKHKGTDKAAHLHPVDLLVAGQKVVFNARYLLLQRSASKGGAVTDNVILEHTHTDEHTLSESDCETGSREKKREHGSVGRETPGTEACLLLLGADIRFDPSVWVQLTSYLRSCPP